MFPLRDELPIVRMKLIVCVALSLIAGLVLINAEPIQEIHGTVQGEVYVRGEQIGPDGQPIHSGLNGGDYIPSQTEGYVQGAVYVRKQNINPEDSYDGSSTAYDGRCATDCTNENSSRGRFTNVDLSVQVGSGATIGDYTDINANCVIGSNSRIGRHSHLGTGNIIHDNVHIGDHVTIRENNEIANNSELKRHVKLGSGIRIGSNTRVSDHTRVHNFASIGNECIVESHSTVEPNANIGSFVYCGRHSSIGPEAVIGDNAVIHRHAKVVNGRHVKINEVIIRSPTSAALYANCLPLCSIPQNDAETVSQYLPSYDVSSEANAFLGQKIAEEIRAINSNCEKGQNVDLSGVAFIKSLYLILYHGINDFNYYSQLTGSYTTILSGEQHFGSTATRNVLTPEVKDLIIRLLVLEEDSQRIDRVTGDTYCKMSSDISNNERNVGVDQ
ncbi:uncharacterized protein LOC119071231 [Bradysia coprophila]|uniref:uncharacterized protein LOC119071231 n=1 Tax=Bradysia coprophila TaxID=38358 RepID=UPI00187D7298|nr:uncharacterized protein LOC119071231 [Bradysia coprophila]